MGGRRTVPRQLPAADRYFTGRLDELKRLDGLLAASDGIPAIAVISGTAGVGNPKPEANTLDRYQAGTPAEPFHPMLRSGDGLRWRSV